MNLSRDYSKCSPAILVQADIALALHRLADTFAGISEAMQRSAEAQAVSAMATAQHLVQLGEILRKAVASNAEHSATLSKHLDMVEAAKAEVENAVDEANKARDALRYAHKRIEELKAQQGDGLVAVKRKGRGRKAEPEPEQPALVVEPPAEPAEPSD